MAVDTLVTAAREDAHKALDALMDAQEETAAAVRKFMAERYSGK